MVLLVYVLIPFFYLISYDLIPTCKTEAAILLLKSCIQLKKNSAKPKNFKVLYINFQEPRIESNAFSKSININNP